MDPDWIDWRRARRVGFGAAEPISISRGESTRHVHSHALVNSFIPSSLAEQTMMMKRGTKEMREAVKGGDYEKRDGMGATRTGRQEEEMGVRRLLEWRHQ